MLPKPLVKGMCIFLAALMALSAVAVLFQVFAVDVANVAAINLPATGDNDADYLIPIGIVLVAVLAVGICVALPKMKQK